MLILCSPVYNATVLPEKPSHSSNLLSYMKKLAVKQTVSKTVVSVSEGKFVDYKPTPL